MTVVDTPLRADSPHVLHKGYRMLAIVNAHTREDGTLDAAALIASAVKARQAVQAQEQLVNRGRVPLLERERLVCLQQIDLDHRAVLEESVPGWGQALARARVDYPRCQKAKVMARAARSLGLWVPGERGPR